MTNKIDELESSISDATRIKAIVDRVIGYKEKLSLIIPDKLSNNQKIWLLAFEASEAKLAKMGMEQTQQSTDYFSESMFTLKEAISDEDLRT